MRPPMDPEVVAQVRALRDRNMTFSQIGEMLGRSRGSVAKIVWRYILTNAEKHRPRGAKPRVRKRTQVSEPHVWTERALTETWAERKARRAAERASA